MLKSDISVAASFAVMGYLVWEDWYSHERFYMGVVALFAVALMKYNWSVVVLERNAEPLSWPPNLNRNENL